MKFEEIAAEVEHNKKRKKERRAYLKTAGFVSRYEEHPCDCCGQKHAASTRTCVRCKGIREKELTLHSMW